MATSLISRWSMRARRLSTNDRQKFDEYFEAIRTIETRMDRIESRKSNLAAAKIERPEEHLPRNEYLPLMGDLLLTGGRLA